MSVPCQLEGLTEKDLLKILTGPKCSLTKQATELMATEGVTLRFGEESLQEIARVSAEVRRLAASLSGISDTFVNEPFVSRSWTAFLERTAAVTFQSRLLLLPCPATAQNGRSVSRDRMPSEC